MENKVIITDFLTERDRESIREAAITGVPVEVDSLSHAVHWETACYVGSIIHLLKDNEREITDT